MIQIYTILKHVKTRNENMTNYRDPRNTLNLTKWMAKCFDDQVIAWIAAIKSSDQKEEQETWRRLSLTANRLYIIRRRKLNQNYMNLRTYKIMTAHFNFLFTWRGGWYWIWKCWFLHGPFWMYPLRNQKYLETDSKPRCVCSRRASQSNSSLNLDFFQNSLIWIFFPSLQNVQVQEYSWSVYVAQHTEKLKTINKFGP